MFDTYIKHYKHYATTYGANMAIFLLVGSFYELYDIQDTVTGEGVTSFSRAVELLGIQVVQKGNGYVSAGFKDTSLHKFAAMLTRENWTVVVIDQVKDAHGSVAGRDVARILSPGTHVENMHSDVSYTAGVWLQSPSWTESGSTAPPTFGAAAFDLTTGLLETYEGMTAGRRDAWSSDDLLHFFQVHPPKELIVWWRGDQVDQPTELFLRRTLGIPTALIHIREASTFIQGAVEKPVIREDLLRAHFKTKSLLPIRVALGISEYPLTERVLCSLIPFIKDHFPSAVELLRPPIAWTPQNSVYMGNHALTQLNMITQREEDSVLALFLKGYTHMGRRAMRRRLLYPISNASRLETLYKEIEWCLQATAKDDVHATLRKIADMSRLHRKLTLGQINAGEILALDQSYQCSLLITGYVASGPLAMLPAAITSLQEYMGAAAQVFDIEKARRASADLFCLTREAGPGSAAIEDAIAAARQSINDIHAELARWSGMELKCFELQEKEASISLAAKKAVITQISATMKTGVPENLKGMHINAKKSSSTLEIPSINALYMRILGLQDKLVVAVKTELPIACDRLSEEYFGTWSALEEWVSQVDMSFTIARVSKERAFVRPEIVDRSGSELVVTGLRHPLIEAQQTRVEYVKHDVRLGVEGEQGWLVYGMNASGKSSLMKAVGVATILAQCGCFVPATRFQFSPFRALFTRILNTDNLWAGLSSFAVEMTELGEILRRADKWSLVLGDEVCSGTESASAMSLVGASLNHLSKQGGRFIFATHLHGLQNISVVASIKTMKVWHLQVRFDHATQRLTYDRTLHPGAGSSLYGLEVAKAMAIPFEVLDAAHEIRRELTGVMNEQEAPISAWNSSVQRLKCESCHSPFVRNLEAHHIRQRSEAGADGRFADGTHMNTLNNLAVLCDKCHDKVHSEEIEVGPVKQTSDGPVRIIVTKKKTSVTKAGGLTSEQEKIVSDEIRAYPNVAPSRMIFDLEQRHGIKITPQRLRTIRATL